MYLTRRNMDDFIKEIKDNLTRKNYLSALALALILPDICGKIAYPDMKPAFPGIYNEDFVEIQ